nr:immunoglobulin light chain junction region [Macaca mulatta]
CRVWDSSSDHGLF